MQPPIAPQACEMKRVLLDRIEKLGAILPANTLDQASQNCAVKFSVFRWRSKIYFLQLTLYWSSKCDLEL